MAAVWGPTPGIAGLTSDVEVELGFFVVPEAGLFRLRFFEVFWQELLAGATLLTVDVVVSLSGALYPEVEPEPLGG